MAQEKPFFEKVYSVVSKIPYGKVLSYGDIAALIGSPKAARQVGWAMRNCPDNLPWQRVVMKDGTVTGGAYADVRRELLRAESVCFLPDGRVDMKTCRWDFFTE
ncbi:MAG: MGMT family protein [Clostridia bacterium]|nr:MGMT family protein [Clostridia bacterium]